MKSLEIVNKEIELIESELQKIENEEDSLFPFDTLMNELEKYSQIKQDLEVLEILKNKKVDIGFVKSILESCSIEESLEVINDCGYRKLTMEELIKLKQWLEVNE